MAEMSKKKLPAPIPVSEPLEPDGDMRRLIRETGPHVAHTLDIVQDKLVLDAASYAALNGLLAHYGLDRDPDFLAKKALEYAKALVEERRRYKHGGEKPCSPVS